MEACSEKWGMAALASPRISFSHDLSTTETHRLDSSLPLDSTADDFDFSLSVDIPASDGSLADELFSDGKLLPLPIKNPSTTSNPPPLPPPPTIPYPKKHGRLREMMARAEDDNKVKKSPSSSSQKSFWRFHRSSSLNCSGGGSRSGLLCSFALLRSKSTGSSQTPNPPPRPDKQYHKKTNSVGGGSSSSSSSINSSPLLLHKFSTDSNARIYYYSGTPRSCGNGVRISPILNVPTASSAFCYLLCGCGDKSVRDKQYHKKTNSAGGGSSSSSSSSINSSPLLLHKFSTDSNARIYYYSGTPRSCGNGVRISPILNVPTASSAFCYLLCGCGDKSVRRGSTVTCSP
ncbi:hypothetical protein COCNU_02G006070 [Cocos nucifera]|uniref:Uncharacterized protein n=1 Tax=Cocos nucifera TaxID=13894 RepID=A0A8K0HYM7_COCNU|nr:hypothetical protein COCNU_02G006070 [Cocos nucifera]